MGRLIDISLQQQNASRYGGFQLTRTITMLNQEDIKQKFFLGKTHQWRDRQHHRIVNAEDVEIQSNQTEQLGDDRQAGMQVGQAKALREGWQLQDKGIVRVDVTVQPRYTQIGKASTALGLYLGFFDQQTIRLQRHLSILQDAGHSDSDTTAHKRTGESALAWHDVAKSSYALGEHIQRYAEPVDAGFNRAKPVFDWLLPWTGKLPKHHLKERP